MYSIGVDIGGTNTHICLADQEGGIALRTSFPTSGDLPAYLRRIADEATRMASTVSDVAGIGIGAPCANSATGCIEAATDLPWPSPINLRGELGALTGLRVCVTNDANAAAAGEHAYGTARGIDNFIMITLGTGVGAGVVVDGHLLSGRRGFAGELGHIHVRRDSMRPCACGRTGCLQTYCSAKGIVATAAALLADDRRQSTLRDIAPGSLTAEAIACAAENGDTLAHEVFDITGTILGEACADYAAFTDPEAFIMFGGVTGAGELLFRPMRQAYRKAALGIYLDVSFMRSSLPSADAALLGAAALPLALDN